LVPACEAFGTVRFDPLPWTRVEIERIAEVFRGHGGADRPAAIALTGDRASEDSFRRLVSGSRVVHVATHGVYLDDRCAHAPPHDSGPRSFSALALAGANRRRDVSAEQDDGILTAEEIASLDLAGVEWVVLSACESGLGHEVGVEGVFGLRRAFQLAGARSVIASLWRVQDESTRAWMEALYAARSGGASTAEAIRRADLSLIQARRRNGLDTHPFYWGAFSGIGDWR
jgi:CHAT domain-containing protein